MTEEAGTARLDEQCAMRSGVFGTSVRVAILLAAVMALACGESGTAPSLDALGEVQIDFITPHDDDRALLLTVTGPVRELRPASGFRAFTAAVDSRTSVVLLAEDGSIPTGRTVIAFITPEQVDTRYVIELKEVAALDHSIRSSLEDYSLELVPFE